MPRHVQRLIQHRPVGPVRRVAAQVPQASDRGRVVAKAQGFKDVPYVMATEAEMPCILQGLLSCLHDAIDVSAAELGGRSGDLCRLHYLLLVPANEPEAIRHVEEVGERVEALELGDLRHVHPHERARRQKTFVFRVQQPLRQLAATLAFPGALDAEPPAFDVHDLTEAAVEAREVYRGRLPVRTSHQHGDGSVQRGLHAELYETPCVDRLPLLSLVEVELPIQDVSVRLVRHLHRGAPHVQHANRVLSRCQRRCRCWLLLSQQSVDPEVSKDSLLLPSQDGRRREPEGAML
mmetsp:Transcript_88196/g.222038  ORF Transcript_88196/g.222038 Transcript_88196/m.222038 type:complete len:292 (-) Transcript_88196:134-1009(-)